MDNLLIGLYKIRDMEVGEIAFTVPWAIYVDQKTDELWIDGDMLCGSEPEDRMQMEVRRHGDRSYTCDLTNCLEYFSPADLRAMEGRPNMIHVSLAVFQRRLSLPQVVMVFILLTFLGILSALFLGLLFIGARPLW